MWNLLEGGFKIPLGLEGFSPPRAPIGVLGICGSLIWSPFFWIGGKKGVLFSDGKKGVCWKNLLELFKKRGIF